MPIDLKIALAGAVLPLAACTAAAQSSPWWAGLSQSFMRDSNFTRVTSGTPPQSSTISTTALIGGLDQTVGRQHLFGTASVQSNRYSGFSLFNNTGYSLRAGVDWSTAERVSGSVSANMNRSLARFNPGDGPSTVRRNLARTNLYDAMVRVGGVTPLTLEAGVSRNELDYSASEYNALAYTQDTLRLGASYRLGADLSLGGALRRGWGRYPRFVALADGSFISDRLSRTDVDITANWQASGASSLNARASYTNTHRDLATAQDLRGLTGALGWVWRPTGKITVVTDMIRDRGVDSYFYLVGVSTNGPLIGQGDNSRVTTRLSLRTQYQATAKVSVEVGLGLADRSLRNAASSLIQDGDRSETLGLSATWQPLRSAQVSCNVYREQRRGGGTLSFPYSVNTTGCSAQLTIQ